MGRKQRRSRHNDSSDEEPQEKTSSSINDHEQEDNEDMSDAKMSKKKNSLKQEMDFATRRDLQRKQAAEKRRSKQKCYLCGRAGHVRRECPGIQDDGRGMSRYKGKSNIQNERQKYLEKKKNATSNSFTTTESNLPLLEYPPELKRDECDDFLYYDIDCDVTTTLEYCQHGRGKARISRSEACAEYQHALQEAQEATNFGGIISRTFLKPNRPWIRPVNVPLPEQTWYMVGLKRDFLCHEDDSESETQQALMDTLQQHDNCVISVWTVLDYSPHHVSKAGNDVESQLRRAHATCCAAGKANVTVQIQVLPAALNLDDSVVKEAYSKVMLDLESLLTTVIQQYPTISIVLASWSGLAVHALTLLQGFPDNLYLGLDGSVTFSKATHLHECAFEIPLEKLLLSTSCVIPSEVANALGRDAFFHSGLWPFVARVIATHKKSHSLQDVARAVSELTLKLYPQLARPAEFVKTTDQNCASDKEEEE